MEIQAETLKVKDLAEKSSCWDQKNIQHPAQLWMNCNIWCNIYIYTYDNVYMICNVMEWNDVVWYVNVHIYIYVYLYCI